MEKTRWGDPQNYSFLQNNLGHWVTQSIEHAFVQPRFRAPRRRSVGVRAASPYGRKLLHAYVGNLPSTRRRMSHWSGCWLRHFCFCDSSVTSGDGWLQLQRWERDVDVVDLEADVATARTQLRKLLFSRGK